MCNSTLFKQSSLHDHVKSKELNRWTTYTPLYTTYLCVHICLLRSHLCRCARGKGYPLSQTPVLSPCLTPSLRSCQCCTHGTKSLLHSAIPTMNCITYTHKNVHTHTYVDTIIRYQIKSRSMLIKMQMRMQIGTE